MAKTQQNIISDFGISLGIGSEKQKGFEKEILDIGSKEKISAPKSNFIDWAFLVHDFNRMHIFLGYAIEAGFKKTPMHGTRIVAFQEQYILKIKSALEEFTEREFSYNNHKIKFERPLFPGLRGAKASWDLEKAVVDGKGVKLYISLIDNKGEKYVSSVVCLGYEKSEKSQEEVTGFLSNDEKPIVHRTRIEIKKGERESFYGCIGKKPEGQVYMMHPAAFIPATLLELSSRRTGRPEGTYRGIEFEFYNPPELGIFETILRLPRAPRELPEGKGFKYKFEALCLQNKKPILSGVIGCISPTEYRLIKS